MNLARGVNVASVTPRGNHGHEVDVGAALELIDFFCVSGVDGIALLGATGEFVNLAVEERNRFVHLAIKRSRVPVIVGVSHSSLDVAVDLGREAITVGAQGLLLMPPYFFRYAQEDIREFYLEFARQIGGSVAVYLYNVPLFTNEIEPATAVELLSTGLFAGIKDSSGKHEYFKTLKELRNRQPFTLLIGNDAIFTPARRAGADGVVSGVACAVPELLVGLDRAIQKGAEDTIDALETRLQEFLGWLNRFPTPIGIKLAAALRGLHVGSCAIPLTMNRKLAAEEFREWFRKWLPAVQREAANV